MSRHSSELKVVKQDNMKPVGPCIDRRTALSRETGTTLASWPVKSPTDGVHGDVEKTAKTL